MSHRVTNQIQAWLLLTLEVWNLIGTGDGPDTRYDELAYCDGFSCNFYQLKSELLGE